MINRFKNDLGQGLVEYGLLLALVSVVAVGSLGGIGEKVSGRINEAELAMEFSDTLSRPNLYTGQSLYVYDGFATGYGTTTGDSEKSILQRDIKLTPNSTYRIIYKRGERTQGLHLLTHSNKFEAHRVIHNRLYTSPLRIKSYPSDVQGVVVYDMVSFIFKTGDLEEYVSITTGNKAIVDEPFGYFYNEYHNIYLYKIE